MAGSSRNASPMKRLMTELQTYQSDPNDALLELGPADDDVMHWRAVMKGVIGTAYEGTSARPLVRVFHDRGTLNPQHYWTRFMNHI
jgi:ubiquitin-protein ligase